MVSLSFLRTTVCGFLAVLAASFVSDVDADASDILLDTIGGGLTKNDMDTIMSMVSIAENSNTEWWTNYNYCEDIHDGRGFTVSLVGFCSGTGDLLEVVRDVQSMNPNHPLVQFIAALEAANGSDTHNGLGNLCATIKANGDDTWKKAVWNGIQHDYLSTALAWAANKQLSSIFSKGFLFDVALNHGTEGLDQIAAYVKPGVQPPSNGGDEVAYMEAYIDARIYVVKYVDTSTNNGQTDRMDMWRSVLDKNNLGLQRPMTLTCYGETFTISGGGGGGGGGGGDGGGGGGSSGLGDWEFCSASSQCKNACCSKQYSDDGKLKCTPGGTPSQCVNGGGGGGGSPATSPPKPTAPPSIGGLGDWQFCSVSSQCNNGCCSKQYSDDGKLKCTPGGTPSQCVGGSGGPTTLPPKPTAPPSGGNLGDWQFCSASSQCKNTCCSKQYSDDGKLKCTPGGSRDQCV